MNELINFLTSKEIIVVYIVAAVACFLCFIVYIIDKTYYKRKRKHNTRELNKLVEEVNHQLEEEGYVKKNLQVQQINAPIGQKTSLLVLAPAGTETRDIYQHIDEIQLIKGKDYEFRNFKKRKRSFRYFL